MGTGNGNKKKSFPHESKPKFLCIVKNLLQTYTVINGEGRDI
jgi:hypothetical protein